jgi:hypothetical protein
MGMPAPEDPSSKLSRSVVQLVLDYWLRRDKDRNEPLDDFLYTQVPHPLDQRRLERRIASLRNLIMERLDGVTGEQLSEPARRHVTAAVCDSLAAADLSPRHIETSRADPHRLTTLISERSTSSLSMGDPVERRYFETLLTETASVLITAASVVSTTRPYVVAQLLRDDDEAYTSLRDLLSDLPTAAPTSDADEAYRLAVVTSLDRAEIVGFTLPTAMRSFSLSSTFTKPSVTVRGDAMPVDWALADYPMLYLTGPAGSGKTALLRWLAVSCARRSLDGLLSPHNDLLPLYLPGRRLGETASEHADSALDFVVEHVRPSLPGSFTRAELEQRCRAGKMLFLVDGLDELGPDGIDRLRRSLLELLAKYPECRFVVSSRRAAVDSTFLADAGFAVASLDPLDDAAVIDLVSRWFSTVGPSLPERTLHASPVRLAGTVIDLVRRSPQLRELASSPLMCALTCGVYLERGAASLSGADIYASFVDMLIERRDVERGLERQRLSRSVASIFLEDLAGYMLIRGLTELPRERVLERFAQVSSTLTHDAPPSNEVLTALLVESSMLVEPEAGRIRFLHQTFLEFLAAQCFLHNDDLDLLIQRAHEPVWRATLVMAVAQARHRQSEELLSRLLSRFDHDRLRRPALAGALQECIRNTRRLDPDLRRRAEDAWQLALDGPEPAWYIWLDDVGPDTTSALKGWLLAEPALRHGGGLTFVDVPYVDQPPRPPDMHYPVCLRMRGNTPLGYLVDALVAWRNAQPSTENLNLAVEIPESSLLVRVTPDRR